MKTLGLVTAAALVLWVAPTVGAEGAHGAPEPGHGGQHGGGEHHWSLADYFVPVTAASTAAGSTTGPWPTTSCRSRSRSSWRCGSGAP